MDVRDVAKAHINAMEMKEAQGRYLITSGVLSHLEIAQMLKDICPEAPVCVDEVRYVLYLACCIDGGLVLGLWFTILPLLWHVLLAQYACCLLTLLVSSRLPRLPSGAWT